MKFYNLIIFIIIFFLKTGNVLSENTIFSVNNIIIKSEKYRNHQEFLNQAYREGFYQLIERISLRKDYKKLKQTSLKDIKNLISHFQIQKISNQNLIQKSVNIYFDKERINKFFFKNNLTYSDFISKKITILPIQYIDNDINIFSNNYFYENWVKDENDITNSIKVLNYILPIENLELIKMINQSNKNYENLKIDEILLDYGNQDTALIHINLTKNKSKIFLQTFISGKKINKSFIVDNFGNTNDRDFYDIIIKKSKQEIEDIIKKENILDLRTPIFLKINFRTKKERDLKFFQNAIGQISVVENYEVSQISNRDVQIKIKFYGNLMKFQKLLESKGIDLNIQDNEWSGKRR